MFQAKETVKKYKWDFKEYGLFEATFSNGELIDMRFSKNGSSLNGNCLWTDDFDFAKCVYKALGEIIKQYKPVKGIKPTQK